MHVCSIWKPRMFDKRHKRLSLYLIFCCVLVLVLGVGLQTGGRMRQQSQAELVSGTKETRSASSKPHFSGKRLSARDAQQCLSAHRTAEVQENANRRSGDGSLYDVLPPTLVLMRNWLLRDRVHGSQRAATGNAQMLLENIRCERLII